MAITFTRAPTVVGKTENGVGDKITSGQMIQMANAFNDRLRSGIGDCTWRIIFFFLSAWHRARNGSEDGLVNPPDAEVLETYINLDPDEDNSEWPIADPGLPEGARLDNPFMAFVFGSPNLYAENVRTDDMQISTTGNLDEIWLSGKLQRGAYDPTTGNQSLTAIGTAASYYLADNSQLHNRSYGGYLPIPDILGDCGDGDAENSPSINYAIKFTNISTGQVVQYPGSCNPTSPNAVNGMAYYIGENSFAYYVFVVGQTGPTIYSKKLWIEGPYSGGARLGKSRGEQLARIGLNSYVKEFRGSAVELADPKYRVKKTAFDFEQFLSSQYLLAPNKGHTTGPEIDADYPSFSFGPASNVPHGTNSSAHQIASGFVLGSIYFKATGLIGSVQIKVMDGSNQIDLVTVQQNAGNPDIDGKIIVSYADAGAVNLSFQLATDAVFSDATGRIDIEASEIVEYRPEIHDAYLLIRLASTHGDELASKDGRGLDFTLPKQISDGYFQYGCFVNYLGVSGLPDQGNDVNDNPVYDSARRFTRQNIRVATRALIRNYAVENGKSVLWFYRYLNFDFGAGTVQLDVFKDIAPDPAGVASGSIIEGETYLVVGSGTLTYNKVQYSPGQQFIGIDDSHYTQIGSASAQVYNAIRPNAFKRGYSNEWLMFPQFKAFADASNENSILKPAAYADYFALSNRCHFYSYQIKPYNNNSDLLIQFGNGQTPLFAAEAPSAFTYAGTANSGFSPNTEDRGSFYRSCQVYPADDEIESCIIDGDGIVKLTFKARFQHCAEAGTSDISKDLGTWSNDALNAEPYRTIENGIRQYLLYLSNGLNTPPKVGDHGYGSLINYDFSNVYATIFPHFFFTRLIRKPYEDGNDDANDWDTRLQMDVLQECELYQRAFCEGFVDETTSIAYSCAAGVAATFDYTWENLNYQAHGNRWVNTIPMDVQGSNNEGFGPLPMTKPWAVIFNQISANINLLDKARITLPFKLQARSLTYYGEQAETPIWTNPAGLTCDPAGNQGARWAGTPPSASLLTNDTGWQDVLGASASVFSSFVADNQCLSGIFRMATVSTTCSYRWALYDDDGAGGSILQLALSPGLAALINNGATGFLALYETTTSTPVEHTETVLANSQQCNGATGLLYDTGVGSGWSYTTNVTDQQTCGLFVNGTLDPGSPVGGPFYAARNGGVGCVNGGGHSLILTPVTDNPTGFVKVPLV